MSLHKFLKCKTIFKIQESFLLWKPPKKGGGLDLGLWAVVGQPLY